MKKMMNLLLISVLVYSLFIPSVDAKRIDKQSVSSFEVDQMKGVVFSEGMKANEQSSVTFDQMEISQKNGNVKIGGVLKYNNKIYDISFSGAVYPVQAMSKKVTNWVIGDISGNKDFNVLQMLVQKENDSTFLMKQNRHLKGQTVFTLVLENKKNGDWIVFQEKVEQKHFAPLFNGAKILVTEKNMTEEQIRDKFVYLLNMKNKSEQKSSLNKQTETAIRGEYNPKEKNDLETPISTMANWFPVNHEELNKVFRDLREFTDQTVYLPDYGVPEALFAETGWKYGHNLDYADHFDDPYFVYYAATEQNLWFALTQISHILLTARFENDGGFFNEATINDSMFLYYDLLTKELSVLALNAGLKFEDVQWTQAMMEPDDDLFYKFRVNGRMDYDEPSGVASFLWGLVPFGEIIYDLYSLLRYDEQDDLGWEKGFENTPERQKKAYDGHLVKVVSGKYPGYYLKNEETNANITGYFLAPDGSYDLKWEVRWTIVTVLA